MQVVPLIDPFALRHDGGNSPTANIDWGGFDLTNVGAGGFTGVVTIEGLGTGGRTDFDLKVGDTTTPDYGMIQIGDAVIGRTSFSSGSINLDGTFLIQNSGGPVTGDIEFCFAESSGNTTRFALPKSAVGNATYNPRSMLIAGPAPADTDYVKVSYWQTNNSIFDNLACDTVGSGADLGVQNDLEVEGDIFVDSIKESTIAAGISFNTFDLTDIGDLTATGTVQAEQLTSTDDITMQGHLLTLGNVGSAADVVMSFLSSGNSGSITYDQTADRFLLGSSAMTVDGILSTAGVTVQGEITATGSPTADATIRASAGEGMDAILLLIADQSDNPGDEWEVKSAAGNNLTFSNDVSGSFVAKATLTTGGRLTVIEGLTIGDGTAADRTIVFNGSANDTTITYDESADELDFDVIRVRLDGNTLAAGGISTLNMGGVDVFRKRVNDDYFGLAPGAGSGGSLDGGFKFYEAAADGETLPVEIHGFPTGESRRFGSFKIVSVGGTPHFQISTDGTAISVPDIMKIGDGGTTNYTEISATGDIMPKGSAFLIFEKASGNGIKVDQTTPTFGFADLLGDQFSKNTGGTKPTLTVYNGAIDAWQFSNGDEAFLSFHIPHDYVLGTDIHLHIHWSQNAAGATGGTIDFKYFAIYAKGHNQASGSAFTSTPITATFSSININDGGAGLTQYQQHLTEVTISAATATAALFDRDDFEPDGVIELTLEMDANNLTGTPSDPFIHYADIHYQTTGLIGTKSRTPDFYA